MTSSSNESTYYGRFVGKSVIITGGVSGIGLAMTEAFAGEGAAVFAADVAEPQEGWDELVKAGRDITYVKTDVTSSADLDALVATITAAHGAVDVLVNNAGLTRIGLLHEMDDAAWDLVINVDLTAVYRGCKAVLPGMVERKSGAIVNTASTLGHMANHLLGAYTAAKHGVVGLTRQVALDYGKSGIRCNAICPGPTETPNIVRSYGTADALVPRGQYLFDSVPLGRMGRPAEIAAAAVFLASKEASFVNGAVLDVDGGHSVHTGPIWTQREYDNTL